MTNRPSAGNVTLRAARKAIGLKSQQSFADAFEAKALAGGKRLGVSVRQVRRWESAEPPWPTPEYQMVLEALFERSLTDLGFTSPDPAENRVSTPENEAADRIIHELQGHGVAGWWRSDPVQTDVGARLELIYTIERAAVAIRNYTAGLVPGLLQTFEYACGALRAYYPAVAEDEIIRRATLRMERQRELERQRNGHRSQWFVLNESALREPVGGLHVLREQLGSLLVTLTRRPDISVQVLPDGLGAHPGMAGMFTVYDLGGRRAVCCEGLTGDSWTCRPSCLASYSLAYDRLQAEAYGAEASIAFIAERLVDLEMACSTETFTGGSALTAEGATASKLRPWTDPSGYETPSDERDRS